MNESLPVSQAPIDLVAPLHGLLQGELGIKSPLGSAVETLNRANALAFRRSAGVQSAQAARKALARSVATGERDFDDSAVRDYDEGSRWVNIPYPSDMSSPIPASVAVAAEVGQQARALAAEQLPMHAPAIFATLAAEAARVVGILAELPEPPRGVFALGDPDGSVDLFA
jgi:hypothetical protein